MKRVGCGLLALLWTLAPGSLHAQGVQTGTLTGTVETTDGATLPGAAVTATSTALQGERSTTTDVNGVYLITSLPPGTYTVKIVKSGLAPSERPVVVPLGSTAVVDARLEVAGVAVDVVVEGVVPAPVSSIQNSSNIAAPEVSRLPMGRTPFLISELMPGLTTNAPVPNQLTIGGGFGFDNVFLIDGVDVNDNLLGTVNDLFIEEAIGEVQVLTSAITAEYGRFSGGVVNIITKSGGNRFAGSYRTTFTNPSWAKETPFESVQRRSKLSTYSEVTAGGPVLKDRLWFFSSGRFENSSTAGALPATAVPYTKSNDNKRYEAKATGTARPGHRLQGTFIDNRVRRANEPVLSFSIDQATMISPSTPNRLGVVNYSGSLSSRLLASAQYSKKHFSTKGVGGTSTNILDSPFLTRTGTLYQYNAPYFDASDPEQRNNRQLTASLSYFLSDRRLGSHEIKGGVEDFVDTRIGANAQSSTGYVFISNFQVGSDGAPALDADGHPIPVFIPGTSLLERWIPHRGAQFDLKTRSAYVQDRWMASPHVTVNLGLRFEHVSNDATGGIRSVSTARVVPRLGASYDLRADGKTVLQASFSQYSGKYNAVQFSRNTSVGNSDRYTTVYRGSAGEGRGFGPGFDVNNYAGVVAGAFPALNISFADDISSPVTTEFTLGAGRMFGSLGYAKAVFVRRRTSNVIEDFKILSSGTSPFVVDGVTVGTLDNILWANNDMATRQYQALQFMGQQRLTRQLAVNGHWTVQLKNDGNFEGEAPSPAGSFIGDYPEMLVPARNAPEGRLDDFQRSKLRVWADYHLGLGAYGSLTVAPIYRYNSAKTYSLAANGVPLSAVQAARNPGYAGTPTQTLFFGARGSESFKGYALVDLALTYDVPVWRSVRPWVKFEAFNLLNNQKLIAWDTTITPDADSARDENGLPTGYVKGARFGQATAVTHYPGPRPGADGGRALDVAIGFRF